MSTAIRDTSVSLRMLLESRLNADPEVKAMLPPGVTLAVSLNTPEEMGESGERGISLWLYRIVRDGAALNLPPRRVAPDRMRLAPMPVLLHYLVTPVFQGLQGIPAPEFEQTLLGKVLQLFHEMPSMRGSDLLGTLAAPDMELTVRLETLSLDDVTRVWDALDRSYQLCISYEVSVVPIEARREIASGPAVMVFAGPTSVAEEVAP
jgi:hypothetical protein